MRHPDDEAKLQRLIDRTLRAQPARRAPASLEARVLAQIERRSHLPWWRGSFTGWPLPARVVFVVASMGFIPLALLAGRLGMESLAVPMQWLQSLVAAGSFTGSLMSSVIQAVPPTWIYGALGFIALMYGALFALGALGYRTLYAK